MHHLLDCESVLSGGCVRFSDKTLVFIKLWTLDLELFTVFMLFVQYFVNYST